MRIVFTILLLISIYNISYCSFSPTKFISRLWNKSEQEVMNKDYPINPKSTIDISNVEGDITIKVWNQNKLVVEAIKKGTAEEVSSTTVNVKSQASHTYISTKVSADKPNAITNYTLMVPETVNVKANISSSGSIKIKQVRGSIDASTNEGSIEITDSTNTVVAKTGDGTIKIKQKYFNEPNSIFVETIKGPIYLYLPREIQANLHARTLQGTITSEQAITFYPQTMKLNKETWDRIKKEVHGTLGNGGSPITLEATRGNIIIEDY